MHYALCIMHYVVVAVAVAAAAVAAAVVVVVGVAVAVAVAVVVVGGVGVVGVGVVVVVLHGSFLSSSTPPGTFECDFGVLAEHGAPAKDFHAVLNELNLKTIAPMLNAEISSAKKRIICQYYLPSLFPLLNP